MSGDSDHDHDFSVATSASHDFSVATSASEGVAFVTVSGQADLHTAPELRSAIGGVIDSGTRALAIDLSDATFIDSMTLGVLLGSLKRLTPLGGKLVIICPGQHVRRVFEITSLDRVLALVDTPEQARERLAGDGRGSVSPSSAEITLDWPDGPDYRAVGRLVLGGVAARADLPVDRVEELGLALDTLARSTSTNGRLSLEMDVVHGALSLRFGTFTADPLEDLAVRRVVSALVDDCDSAVTADGHLVVLSANAGGKPTNA